MYCPKCLRDFGITSRMEVTNSYTSAAGTTQRVECVNPKCGMVGSAIHVLVQEDPCYGRGAKALSNKLARGDAVVTVHVAGNIDRGDKLVED